MIGQAIYTLLHGDASVSALTGTRIKPGAMSQNLARPCITWTMQGPRPESMSGTSGVVSGSVRVSAWADTYSGADDLANKMRSALEGQRGTYSSTAVMGIVQNDADDDYVPPFDGSDRGIYSVTAFFRVFYDET